MWKPLAEADLRSMIEAAEESMEPRLERFWNRIRIEPQKWQLSPWSDMGGGFWVVAVIGMACIWYNDIEDGFNIGPWNTCGRICDYSCNQSGLEDCVRSGFDMFRRDLGLGSD